MMVQVKVSVQQGEEKLLASKQLDLIYRRHPFALWSTLLLSGGLAIALWPMVDHAVLLAWLLSLWLVMAVRDVYARKYLKLAREAVVGLEKWQAGMLAGAAMTGLCWGFSVLSIPSSPTEPAAMLLLFVLGGVTAFSSISMAAVPLVANAFLLSALLPVSFWLFSFGERLPFFMGGIALGYLVLMLLFSRQTYRTIRSLLSATEQNKELAVALAQVKALERESALFRRIVDETRDPAIFVANTKNTHSFDYINEAVCAHFGASREEIMSWHISDWDPHYDEVKVAELGEALKQTRSMQFESEHLKATGERFPVEVTLNLIEFEGESFVVGYFRSLTQYKAEQARMRQLASAAIRQESELRMAEALLAREQEFRSLAESSPDFIIRYDREGRIRYGNAVLLGMLGLSRAAEVIGKLPREMWPDGRFDAIEQAAARVVESGVVETVEQRLPNGDVHHILIAPERDAAGQIIGSILFGRDITEIKKIQQRMALLERAINQSSDAIFLMDEQCRFSYVNAAACRSLGYSREELATMTPPDIDPNVTIEQVREMLRNAALGKIDIMESHHRSRDWRVFPVEISASNFVDEGTRFSFSVVRDISERKQAELELQDNFKRISELNVHLERNARDLEELAVELEVSKEQLQQTEAWYRGIVQSAPDGLLVVDERGHIIQVNAQLEAMFDYECGELAGCHVDVLLPQAAWAVMTSGGAVKDMFGRRKDGSAFPVDVSLSRLPDLDGRVGAICAAVRDVTERQRMDAARESALSEALRLAQLRSAFMAQMSHELRTPLNGILGYAQNLLQGGSLGEKQVSGLQVIRQSGEHLLTLINGLLDHAAIEAGKFELVPGDIELESFLGAIIGMIRVRAEQKNISFACEVAADMPAAVYGDAQRLRQVLLNLLSNAVKFTDSGYVVLRVSHSTPSRVLFEVRDSGVGIAADQLESIFLPFEQVGEVGRRAGGSGLGLAISRKLVRLMGGDIRVESQPGAGSVFSFEIDMESAQSGAGKINATALVGLAATLVAQVMPHMIIPPKHELDILHGMAMRGSMRDVMRYADQLEEADERYQPFAEQLRLLAKSFQTKALIGLIVQSRNEKEFGQ